MGKNETAKTKTMGKPEKGKTEKGKTEKTEKPENGKTEKKTNPSPEKKTTGKPPVKRQENNMNEPLDVEKSETLDPEVGGCLVNVYLAPEGATEREILAMEDELNGTNSAAEYDKNNPTEKEPTMSDNTPAENASAENASAENAPEVQNNRKIAAVLKKNACAAVRAVIDGGALADHANNEDFLNVLKIAVGHKEMNDDAPKTTRNRMYGKLQGIENLFMKDEKISEFVLFEQFSVGRAEMMAIRRKFATKENPADRLYLSLDPVTKAWKLAGRGETLPEGFHLQTRRPNGSVNV